MVIVSRGRSVRITAIPEDTEDEKKTKDLVEKMRAELHKLNETDEDKKKREEEEI